MSNKPGYKYTKIGWLPNDWEVLRLDKLGVFKNGINKDKGDFGHGFPMVGLMDVFGIPRVYNNKNYSLVNSTIKERKDFSLKIGDVLFVRSSVKPEGVGLPCLVCEDIPDATFSGFIIRFRANGALENEYKAHCFFEEGFRKHLLNKSTISANTNINQVALASLLLPVPNIAEQRKIGTILSVWDEGIFKMQMLIAQMRRRNRNLTLQLLTGRKRLNRFSKPWKEIHLGDAFNERNEIGNITLNLLSIGSLGVYPQSQSDKRDTSNSDKAKYKRICPGDIGYNTMRMWQGRSALSSLEGIVSPAYTIVTPKEEQYSKFYAYLFKLPSVVNKFFRNSQGLVEDTLNCKFKDFSKVKVEVPDYEEQVAIANVLTAAQAEIKSYGQKLIALQQQKKALMQKLLTGEVRVKIEDQNGKEVQHINN